MIYQLTPKIGLERTPNGAEVVIHTPDGLDPILVPFDQLRLAMGFMEQEAMQTARAERAERA